MSLGNYVVLRLATRRGLTSFVKLLCSHPSFNPYDPRANVIAATMNPPRPELFDFIINFPGMNMNALGSCLPSAPTTDMVRTPLSSYTV